MSYKIGTVSSGRLEEDSVTSAKIANDAIVSALVADDQITGAELADNITLTGKLTCVDLDVSGTTTTIDTANLQIADKNILLSKGNSTSAALDGSGITIDGGTGDDITFQWNATNTRLEAKKGSSSFADLKVGTIVGSIEGSADQLTTARTIAISGDATGSVSFDGSQNVSLAATLATVPVSKGGTGSTDVAGIKTLLSLGTASEKSEDDFVGASSDLDDIAALSHSSNGMIVSDGSKWEIKTPSASRTALGLGTAAVKSENDFVGASSDLDDIAALSHSSNGVIVSDGSKWEIKTPAQTLSAIGAASSTTNTGDVTLSGSYDYLSISGQAITVGQVDAATDITGVLGMSNGGLGASDPGSARTALGLGSAATTSSSSYVAASGLSAYGATLIDDADAATARTTLGLGAAATQGVGSGGLQSYHDRLNSITTASAGALGANDLGAFCLTSTGSISTQKYNEFGLNNPVKQSVSSVFGSSGDQSVTGTPRYIVLNCSSGSSFDLTLPALTANDDGKCVTIKADGNVSNSYTVTVKANGSQTIDGAASFTLDDSYQALTLIASSSAWLIV